MVITSVCSVLPAVFLIRINIAVGTPSAGSLAKIVHKVNFLIIFIRLSRHSFNIPNC